MLPLGDAVSTLQSKNSATSVTQFGSLTYEHATGKTKDTLAVL
jgi:hypothetical protein